MKVGDKVRIVDAGCYSGDTGETTGLFLGNTGTVVAIDGHIIGVRTDNAEFPSDSTGKGYAFYAEELEVVE